MRAALLDIPEPARTATVNRLRQVITPEVAANVSKAIEQHGENWWIQYHMGWGTWVRNQITEVSRYVDLDDVWYGLVEEAVAPVK